LTQHLFAFSDDLFGRFPKLVRLLIQILKALGAALAQPIPVLFAREKGGDQSTDDPETQTD
jgi:hypothetical protein